MQRVAGVLAVAWLGVSAPVIADGVQGVPEGGYTDKHLSSPMIRAGEERSGRIRASGSTAPRAGAAVAADSDSYAAGTSDGEGAFEPVRESGQRQPLSRAVAFILPMDCWETVIENGLENTTVSWGTGREWPGVLRRAVDRAGLAIHFNYNDCLVGIASEQDIARELTLRAGNVWRVREGDTLRETVEDWADRAGWHISWEADIDYEIQYGATLIGYFRNEGQGTDVVHKLLSAYRDAPLPLRDRWQTENRVLRIVEDRGRR